MIDAKSALGGKTPLLMTGATGLVGSRFVEMFGSEYEIANMDLTTGVDITNKATIDKFVTEHPAKVMIHLAAFTNTNEAYNQTGDQHGLCYKVNVDGTRNIAEVCREHGIYLIHVSTDFVFDGKKETPYVEEDLPAPLEWYGETKAIAEAEVAKSGAKYTVVRLSYPYRAHYELKPDLIQKIRTGLETGKLYPQFTDTIITPTFIDDIAKGFEALVRNPHEGIYHFTGSTALSPFDLAKKVAETFGYEPGSVKEGSLTEYLKSAARPFARKVAMSNAKATSDLGLHFATIEAGLAAISK